MPPIERQPGGWCLNRTRISLIIRKPHAGAEPSISPAAREHFISPIDIPAEKSRL
jgi:hypothetical protein